MEPLRGSAESKKKSKGALSVEVMLARRNTESRIDFSKFIASHLAPSVESTLRASMPNAISKNAIKEPKKKASKKKSKMPSIAFTDVEFHPKQNKPQKFSFFL